MSAGQSPIVRRRRLGARLRELREQAGVAPVEVARHLECSTSKVSRIETGQVPTRARDVRDMLDLYGITDTERREALLALARQTQEQGWWEEYDDVLADKFATYIGYESAASALLTYNTHLVHGLLQTADYARALLRAALVPEEHDIERMVELRMRRQEVLTREEPLTLWAVMDEAVLRRAVGGPDVMRAQLERLVEEAERPNVTLQVLPFAKGAHAGVDGAFSVLEFGELTDPPVVYVENAAGNIYVEKERDVRRHAARFQHLRAAALDPGESVEFLRSASKEMT